MQIWDTAGQERYMAVNRNIFHRVQVLILMYDITYRDTYENISKWLELIRQNVPNKPMILVGNKLDLANEKRIVTKEEAQKIAEDNHIEFFEGSGYSGENVDKIFSSIAEKVYKYLLEERNEEQDKNIKITSKKNQKRKCC